MKNPAFLITICITVGLISCKLENQKHAPNKDYVQILIEEENTTPTVDIPNFTLITNNPDAERGEAGEVLKVKRKIPLAMQAHDSVLFDETLAKDFTFRAADEFFNRADFIQNRIAGTWTIDTVKYQNLALQFFGDIALLTYRNILTGTDDAGKADLEYYSWADVFKKENGAWKFLSIHCMDARVEYPAK